MLDPIGVAVLSPAALIAVVLWGAASLVETVPLCALSAVIAHAAVRLLEWGTLGRLWSRRHLGSGRDFCVWVVAFVGTLLLGALWGCAVAVATSLLLVLRTVAAPNLTVLRVERAGGRWEQEAHKVAGVAKIGPWMKYVSAFMLPQSQLLPLTTRLGILSAEDLFVRVLPGVAHLSNEPFSPRGVWWGSWRGPRRRRIA